MMKTSKEIMDLFPDEKLTTLVMGWGSTKAVHWFREQIKQERKELKKKKLVELKRKGSISENLLNEQDKGEEEQTYFDILTDILIDLKKLPSDDLILLGLKRNEDNEVVCQLNERVIDERDVEHMLCKVSSFVTV